MKNFPTFAFSVNCMYNSITFWMKFFLSICLALIMAASVTVPLMVQWQGEDVYEMKEKSADDTDDDLKESKEKSIYVLNINISSKFNVFFNENTSEKQYHKYDSAISENHASLPELPPEA